MKHLLLLLLLLVLAPTGMRAQNYAVYRAKGEAVRVVRQQRTPLQKGMAVTPKDVLNLAAGAELKLFSEEQHEMVTLRGQCAGSVSSLIAAQQNARQHMTEDYFAFILKSMTGQNEDMGMQAGRTTAIFRDDTDSLLADTDEPAYLFPLLCTGEGAPQLSAACLDPVPTPQPRLRSPRIRRVIIPRINTGKNGKKK